MEHQPDTAIEFKNYGLSAGFVHPLRNITFSLNYGDSLAIIGPAGSGKSMLLYVISQMIWEASIHSEGLRQRGLCKILGHQVTPRRPSFPTLEILRSQTAIVGEKSAWLPISIAENFALTHVLSGAEKIPHFVEIIDELPLTSRLRTKIEALAELLPNQVEPPLLQQLAIMRALLRKPTLLLFDEPFLRMDPVMLKQTETLILESVGERSTVIWATNDLHQASRVADSTLFMVHGRVMEFTATTQFYTTPKTREAEAFIAGREIEV